MIDLKKYLSAIQESIESMGQINTELNDKLGDTISSSADGFNSIREVLEKYSVEMPTSYEYDPEGDEIVFDLTENGVTIPGTYLYVIFYQTDDGRYDFFAEVCDEVKLNELMSEDTTE